MPWSRWLTLIFGVLRIINFAHGTLMMLGMYADLLPVESRGRRSVRVGRHRRAAFFLAGILIERLVIAPNRPRPSRTSSS